MRSVLVTGASGVLGSRLVHGLARGGWAVRALVKPGDPYMDRLQGSGADIRQVDLESPGEALTGGDLFRGIEVVYHLAAIILSPDRSAFDRINRQGTAHMVAGAAAAGVKHFIYVSSASVAYPRRTPYAESKLAGEALVSAEKRFHHTIVRPTLIYDENGGQEFLLFWRYLQTFPIVPFIGDGLARKRPVFAGDIVNGLLAIAGNPRSHDRTYDFSGGESISMRELAELMLAVRGQRKRFLHLPVWLAQAVAVASGLVMADPPLSLQGIAGFVNDADRPPDAAMTDLGYRPAGVREGLARYFAWPRPTTPSRVPPPVPAAELTEGASP